MLLRIIRLRILKDIRVEGPWRGWGLGFYD